MDFDTNGTPEALDERNPYSATSQSHWEGSQTLKKGPNPKNCSTDPKNQGQLVTLTSVRGFRLSIAQQVEAGEGSGGLDGKLHKLNLLLSD